MGKVDKEDLKQEEVKVGLVITDSYDENRLFGPLEGCGEEGGKAKILQPLAGGSSRPLLYYTLSLMLHSGVREVILFTSTFPDQIKAYLASSHFGTAFLKVSVVSNEEAVTLGDAMRHIYDSGLIRDTFVMSVGCVVGNVNLSVALEEHKARAADDKDLTMTLVFKQAEPGHHLRSASRGDQTFLATVPSTNKILHHVELGGGGGGSAAAGRKEKVSIPLELFTGNGSGGVPHPEVEFVFDVVNTGVYVCSPVVPGLFADNFDCQSMSDFVKGCIQDDLADHNLYAKVIGDPADGYLAKVTDFRSYLDVTRDVLNRWAYPHVPDRSYMHCQHQVYKQKDVCVGQHTVLEEDIIMGQKSRVGDDSFLSLASIGDAVQMGNNVRVTQCVIHDDVTIADDVRLDQCVIGEGCRIGKGVRIGPKCVLGPGCKIRDDAVLPQGTWLVSSDDFGDECDEGDNKFGAKAFPYQHDFGEQDDDSSDEEDSEDEEGGRRGGGDEGDKRRTAALLLASLWGIPETEEGGFDQNDDEEEEDDDGDSSGSDSDSQGSDFAGELQGDLLLDEDAKTSVFLSEVSESLQRGIEEGVDANNLILEINSSRHAYAMNATQVIQYVLIATLDISGDGSAATAAAEEMGNKRLLINAKKNLSAIKDVLANYVRTAGDQADLLKGLEKHFRKVAVSTGSGSSNAVVPQIVHHLYDMDLVEDDAIIKWNGGIGQGNDEEEDDYFDDTEESFDKAAAEAKSKRKVEFAADLKKRLAPLIEWLQNEDESSEEEDDSD